MADPALFWLTLNLAVAGFVVSGVFLAFSNFIMKALARIDVQSGIAAMNAINITVRNPVFMLLLFGTASMGLVAIVWSYVVGDTVAWLLLVAGLLYWFGCIGVTVVFNVPLNNALAAPAPGVREAAILWTHYIKRWTFWNSVRTAAGFAAGVIYITALWLGCCNG
jgi:uncharacterized membrane protein